MKSLRLPTGPLPRRGVARVGARSRGARAAWRFVATSMLACLVLGVGCGASPDETADGGRLIATTSVPRQRTDAFFAERHAELGALPGRADARLVFVGDSITQHWETEGAAVWARAFAPRHALNLGLNGDRTEHVLWRFEHGALDGLDPGLVVLLIGTNNTRYATDREVAAGVLAVLAALREALPGARVLLVGLLPKNAHPEHPIRTRIQRINALLAGAAAADPQVDFVDIGGALVEPDGWISPAIMPDYLHLSPAGYARFAEGIEPYVAAALGEGANR